MVDSQQAGLTVLMMLDTLYHIGQDCALCLGQDAWLVNCRHALSLANLVSMQNIVTRRSQDPTHAA